MFQVTSAPGLVHISSDDSYLQPASASLDLNAVLKEITEHQTESGISLLLETQNCDIEKAFKLCDLLDEKKIRTTVVLKGCCGSFATVLALWADSLSMLPGALCLPIDPTYPVHRYPLVYDLFSNIPRYLNPSEFKNLFSFLEEEIPLYHKLIKDEIIESVGEANLEAAKTKHIEIRDRIKRSLLSKRLKAAEELADFITLDCGSFEHWISRRKLEEFGFEFSHETSISRGDTVEPIILSPTEQEGYDKTQYLEIADLLNSHILIIKKNFPIDFNLLKKCSDLLWLNRDSFGDRNLTVLLDSFGGSETNTFALTEILKDFFPNYQVIVTQDARSSATLFCICSPKVLYRKTSLFGCFGASVSDYSRSGVCISESMIHEGLKKVKSEEIQTQMIRNIFKEIHPIQIAQAIRAQSLVRELVLEVNRKKITPGTLDFFTREIFPHNYPLTAAEVVELLPLNNFEELSSELEAILRKINKQ